MRDKIILGENCEYSSDSSITNLNNNIAVVGGSGSGKTRSIVEPILLETKNASLIVVLTKRRLFKKYSELFRKRKYEVLDLNYADPVESGASFDHLAYIASYADINFVAKSIVKADPRKDSSTADPYWDEASISLLSAEMAYAMGANENATFADVLDMHSHLRIEESCGSIRTSFDAQFDALEETDPDCYAVSCWKSFCNLPIKTAGRIYSTLNTTIDTIFSPEIK